MSNEAITIIKTEANPIATRAQALVIDSPEVMAEAVELLSQANQILDRVTEEKEKITKPLNEALGAERKRWKPIELVIGSAVEAIRTKMSEYQTALARKAAQDEAKIAAKMQKGTIKPETAIRKANEIEKPIAAVAAVSGSVSFRATPTVRVVDIKKIPAEYLVVNEAKILAAHKAGIVVQGVAIDIIQVPVNRR